MNKLYVLSLVILSILFPGCFVQYGNTNIADYAPTVKTDCIEKPNSVVLYFEGETIPFEYEQCGLIEVQGGPDANMSELLDRVKYEAFHRCANAVIGIKKTHITREQGIIADAFDKNHQKNYYTSTTFNGIAVRVKSDSTAPKFMQSIPDTLFLKNVDSKRKKEGDIIEVQMCLSLIATVVIVIAAALGKFQE